MDIFLELDPNGDGLVPQREFQGGMQRSGSLLRLSVKPSDVAQLLTGLDNDGNGSIDAMGLGQFVALRQMLHRNYQHAEAADLFVDFTKAGTKSEISSQDFLGGMQRLHGDNGMQSIMSVQAVQMLCDAFDTDGSGAINFGELLASMMRRRRQEAVPLQNLVW